MIRSSKMIENQENESFVLFSLILDFYPYNNFMLIRINKKNRAKYLAASLFLVVVLFYCFSEWPKIEIDAIKKRFLSYSQSEQIQKSPVHVSTTSDISNFKKDSLFLNQKLSDFLQNTYDIEDLFTERFGNRLYLLKLNTKNTPIAQRLDLELKSLQSETDVKFIFLPEQDAILAQFEFSQTQSWSDAEILNRSVREFLSHVERDYSKLKVDLPKKRLHQDKLLDRFGRQWYLTQQPLEHDSEWALYAYTPTPNGFVGLFQLSDNPFAQEALNLEERYNVIHFGYYGTPTQWKAFMEKFGSSHPIPGLQNVRIEKQINIDLPDVSLKTHHLSSEIVYFALLTGFDLKVQTDLTPQWIVYGLQNRQAFWFGKTATRDPSYFLVEETFKSDLPLNTFESMFPQKFLPPRDSKNNFVLGKIFCQSPKLNTASELKRICEQSFKFQKKTDRKLATEKNRSNK